MKLFAPENSIQAVRTVIELNVGCANLHAFAGNEKDTVSLHGYAAYRTEFGWEIDLQFSQLQSKVSAMKTAANLIQIEDDRDEGDFVSRYRIKREVDFQQMLHELGQLGVVWQD